MFFKRKKEDADIDWNNFYKSVAALVIPLALQNLINVGLPAADVFMLGMVSEYVLAGAAIANQVQMIMILFLFGLGSGLTVLAAQYWGKGDIKTIEKILAMGIKTSMVIALVFTIAAITIPYQLLGIFTNDTSVISYGVQYIRIVAISYIFMGFTMSYLLIMRSAEKVIVATVIYSCSLTLNIFLNALLIFGLWGIFPAMGIVGAAIGTVIARIFEVVLIFGYARFINKTIKVRPKYFRKSDKDLRRDFIRYAIPVVINEGVWGLAVAANTAILGHMSSSAIAANSAAQVIRQLSQVATFGLAGATAIYVGKTIGEQKLVEAKAYARKFTQLSVISGVIGGVLILITSPLIISMLNFYDEARVYLQFMLIVMSYFVVAQAYNATMIVGTFRAGGDTRFGIFADFFSMWTGSLALAFIGSRFLGFGVPVVYVLLMSDELIKIPITTIRYKSYKWLKNVTREFS
jgi:putative MATE family efflux protein